MMPSELFVVIPTGGQRADLLRRTLDSLAVCEQPPSYRGTIVVENGGRGAVEHVVASFRECVRASYRLLSQPSKNAALNLALDELDERALVLFADDDVRFDRHTLRRYSDAAAAARCGVFFGGPVAVDYEVPPSQWLLRFLPNSARGWEWMGPDTRVEAPLFLGFNWGAFVGDIRAAGAFDPTLGPGTGTLNTLGDEVDMQRRLLDAGVRGQYVPEARVWHYVPQERCSHEWVIERARRTGVERGLKAARAGSRGLGRAALVTRHAVKRAQHLVVSRVAQDPQRRFNARYWGSLEGGIIEGLRLQRGA